MRLDFLSLSDTDRADLLREAARRRGVAEPIMEKDFWVSWMLGVLFENPEVAPHVVFKGGTSLSKVARAIDRFSEDIDLALAPEFVGVTAEQIVSAQTRTQRDALMKTLEAACGQAVRERIRPALETTITRELGSRSGGGAWLEYVDDEASGSPILQFNYPSSAPAGFEYLTRLIKLEFGSLTDQRPTGVHAVGPWAAEEFPDAFTDWRCDVVALEVERTFWEKATILHGEAHRELEKPMPPRYSRHFSDLAALAETSVGARALERPDLRKRVVAWKADYFARAWARYDLAVPGTFKLLPPDSRIGALKADYKSMEPMFVGSPPKFEQVMDTLEKLEKTINSEATA